MFDKKGSAVSGIVGLMVIIILLVSAVIPIVQSAISDANITGTASTLVAIIPTFLGILGIVVVASGMK